MSPGHQAIVELSTSLLENILQSAIDRVVPSGQTFADPRPGRGPYTLLPGLRLTLSPPSRPLRAGISICGAVAALQDTCTGETGCYTIYFDVRSAPGQLSLHIEFIDPARSQPINHLPPALLHLALAGQGPISWGLPTGLECSLQTTLGDPGRVFLYITSKALRSTFQTSLSEVPEVPDLRTPSTREKPLLRRPPSGPKSQGVGPVQVIHREDWAVEVDEAVARAIIVEAIGGLGPIQAEGSEVRITRVCVPTLITGGLVLELEATVNGVSCSARGPLYIGYYLERAGSDAPQLKISFNATKLQISGRDGLPGLLYPLSSLLPPLLLLVLPGVPATLETWVWGELGCSLRRATNQGIPEAAKATLVSEALRLLPPELAALAERQSIVRLDFGSQGLTIGVCHRPPPRSGVTKLPLEVPLRIHAIGPASILIGWRQVGDLFASAAEGEPCFEETPRVDSQLARHQDLPVIAGFAPLVEPVCAPEKMTLYLSGAALDGIQSAHAVSGFHRRSLSIAAQSPQRMNLEWDLAGVPPGLWDLEFEWSGLLANGVVYSDRLTFRNQVRTYLAAPPVRADDRPLRVLTKDGEAMLLQLASGLIAPLGDASALRERLRQAPAADAHVVDVEVPLAPSQSLPDILAVEHLGDDHFIVDAGEFGRLRVRPLPIKSDDEVLAKIEALVSRLPHHELG